MKKGLHDADPSLVWRTLKAEAIPVPGGPPG